VAGGGGSACINDKEDIKTLLQGEGKLTEPHNFPHMQRLLGERSLLWMTGRAHQQKRRILSLVFRSLFFPPLALYVEHPPPLAI
jgi:cytochrome P450